MKKIVIFASGSGSNAEKIILHFKNNTLGNVVAVFTNNPHAKVLERAKKLDIATQIFDRESLNNGEVLEKIKAIQPDLIVLAGFLWKFPENIIKNSPIKINKHSSSIIAKIWWKRNVWNACAPSGFGK